MTRGDGDLHVTFLRVGHGNCTLITCPDGKLVVVDCGSSRKPIEDRSGKNPDLNLVISDIVSEIVDNNNFLYDDPEDYMKKVMGIADVTHASEDQWSQARQNMQKIDALIMSHPDKDHYNLLVPLFWKFIYTDDGDDTQKNLKAVRFERIYYVMDLGMYKINTTSDWIHNDVNANKNYAPAQPQDPGIHKLKLADIPNNSPLEILEGTNPHKGSHQPCKIYILLADYRFGGGDEDAQKNNASIVVKVKFGNEAVLLPGDATIETEAELLRRYRGTTWLKSDVLVLGHHGSDTSSSSAFIDAVDPDEVIVSSKWQSYSVPKESVITKCMAIVETDVANSIKIGYFKDPDPKAVGTKKREKLDTWEEVDNRQEKIYYTEEGSLPYSFP